MNELPVPAGDPACHLSADALAEGWARLPLPPHDEGRVQLLVTRSTGGRREHESVELTTHGGVVGDRP